MVEFLEFLKAYKDVGWAGACLYIIFVFYKELKSSNAEKVDMTIKMIQALDQSSTAMEESTATQKDMRRAIDDNKANTQSVIDFIKGQNDERRRS